MKITTWTPEERLAIIDAAASWVGLLKFPESFAVHTLEGIKELATASSDVLESKRESCQKLLDAHIRLHQTDVD